MSKAEPMPLQQRLHHYIGSRDPNTASERDLTPAQRRRAWHKAHRHGERGNESEVLYGRKGRPTPRRPRRG